MAKKGNQIYNAQIKEKQLRAESESWDIANISQAKFDDIPIIDLEAYFGDRDENELNKLADQLRYASTNVGFFYIKGHGISPDLIRQTFSESRRFHDLPLAEKIAYAWIVMNGL